ncbi:xanthine dehydrogenase accessory factor [Yoonia maricola]|uniref:Xanthine dehydrogenase accessory factor n=1 Tax=Yoonia maricola TaxID=420999 RepID=A0A2M8WKQ4_9RHOB|nr:XdhC family protein [Yoonia maricola]PJI91500.1 xanthine dehydrogenase accessory factor [Yoonia maricola]
MTDNITDLPQLALDWHRAGRGVAIATVVATWGSAPRPVGSQLVIDADGAMEGSVSGGCVEGAVVTDAIDAITAGEQRLLSFGVSDDEAFAVGLACGGEIKVLIEPVGSVMPVEILERLTDARSQSEPVVYVTDIEKSQPRLHPAAAYPDRQRSDTSGIEADGRTFVAVHNPPLRMIIVGAVHIAQHLVGMARACGYKPILVDPRPAFGSQARFPGEAIQDDWPDAALRALKIDARTAVVTLTHDPKLDDPAIVTALESEAFYLGCLGSTRTHAKRVIRLKEVGFTDDEIGRIHAPVGLDIGGRQPAEIAVSIMAEVTQTLRKTI